MRMTFFYRLVSALGFLLALNAPAYAHPHAWIEARVDFVFNDKGQITALNLDWLFDPGYSATAIEGLDTNKDGFYSENEVLIVATENLAALKDYNYFIYLTGNNKPVEFLPVKEYGQIYNNKQLHMYFTVPLKKPLDPRQQKTQFKIYDPSFFIAIDFGPDKPVQALGGMDKSCKIEIKPRPSDKQIEETRSMLASKDAEWAPAQEEDFGAMFAQPVIIECQAKAK